MLHLAFAKANLKEPKEGKTNLLIHHLNIPNLYMKVT
jgi:hypothetical protein